MTLESATESAMKDSNSAQIPSKFVSRRTAKLVALPLLCVGALALFIAVYSQLVHPRIR